jgi:O-antigen/teichoic acid export membrane protein
MPDDKPRRPRRPIIERRPVETEPGAPAPGPWSVRGTLTMALCMVVLNIPVAALVYYAFGLKNDKDTTFLSALVLPSPFLFLLYALVAMPFARRLAQEPRRMRPLETLAAGAVMYIVYQVSITAAVLASGHNADVHDGKQMAGIAFAALIGTGVGAALYPVVFRKLWMPRPPGTGTGRRPPGGWRGPRR